MKEEEEQEEAESIYSIPRVRLKYTIESRVESVDLVTSTCLK